MLHTLRIRNLALVSDLTVELAPGYNAVTGETGAGKSIIIGALTLLLGERADRTMIRSGSDSCSVEAVFDAPPQPEFAALLEERGLEPCEDGKLILKRVFTAAGSNKQHVNGSPATLVVLKEIGELLADLHGPHEHQSLLQTSQQLSILDRFGNLEELRGRFTKALDNRKQLQAEKAALIVDERTYAQQLDLLRHQRNEITAARLHPDEEQEAEETYQRASNAARLLEAAQQAVSTLDGEENSVFQQLAAVGRSVQELARLDKSAANLAEIHSQALELLHDLQRELEAYTEKVDLDPAQLQAAEERLTLIQSLKRKYGSSLAEVIAHGEEAARKLQQLESRDAELERINAALEKNEQELRAKGGELSKERQKTARKLARTAVAHLEDLGFKQSQFEVSLKQAAEPQATGFDNIEFLFSPNPGEPLRPLRAIASSGEMARVMLALKSALADTDQIPVLVFDEVDANVGGETATAVGRKMQEIGRRHQVLCITHLAPVAAQAPHHFRVSKEVAGGRTTTTVVKLDPAERVNEIARMLGGTDSAAKKHAESLLASGK
ncbi:MAG TPA: DNA repair protein RecN [Methylomirabilota bacterium]|nr:DNA repair protein RecN [Methylomirabilota bacterium]